MRRAIRATLLAVALLWISASSFGQSYSESFGNIYLTTDVGVDPFDLVAGPITNCIDDPNLPPFTVLEFFLVIDLDFADIGHPEWNASNGLGGWEVSVHMPADLVLTFCNVKPIYPPFGDCHNFIVGTGIVINANSMPYAVVDYGGILLEPAQDLRLTLSASTPSSFDRPGGPGPVPGWLEGVPTGDCLSSDEPIRCLRAFRRWRGCQNELVINYTGAGGCAERCALAVETTSWSTLKATY